MGTLSSALIAFAISVLNLLPTSPFVALEGYRDTQFYEILQMVNWFIPVNTFLSILEAWLPCVLVYYGYQVVLRWVKMIE